METARGSDGRLGLAEWGLYPARLAVCTRSRRTCRASGAFGFLPTYGSYSALRRAISLTWT